MSRTFLGPIMISVLASPIIFILHSFEANKFWTQYIGKNEKNMFIYITRLHWMIQPLILVRLVLAACVAISWSALQRTLQMRIGSTFSRWYTLITISQFHFMFYMSRTLPNIIALPFGDYFLITISVKLTMTYLSSSHRLPWVKTGSCTNKITFL